MAAAHTAAGSISESESSVLPLKGNRISTDRKPLQSLTFSAKLDIAYNLVQCAFYLLGTLWLAYLKNENLGSIETYDRSVLVLKVEFLRLHWFVLENPDGLPESFQLLQIGIVLIDTALDGLGASDFERFLKPGQWAAKKLPLVHEALGSSYFRACAFCVPDQRSTFSFHRHEKYEYPRETAWKWDLEQLLRQYHEHVVSR